MFYILMAMVIALIYSSDTFLEIRDLLFWTSVCLTFSLCTFVLPIGDGYPSTSHLGEESKRFEKPILIASAAYPIWSASCSSIRWPPFSLNDRQICGRPRRFREGGGDANPIHGTIELSGDNPDGPSAAGDGGMISPEMVPLPADWPGSGMCCLWQSGRERPRRLAVPVKGRGILRTRRGLTFFAISSTLDEGGIAKWCNRCS